MLAMSPSLSASVGLVRSTREALGDRVPPDQFHDDPALAMVSAGYLTDCGRPTP